MPGTRWDYYLYPIVDLKPGSDGTALIHSKMRPHFLLRLAALIFPGLIFAQDITVGSLVPYRDDQALVTPATLTTPMIEPHPFPGNETSRPQIEITRVVVTSEGASNLEPEVYRSSPQIRLRQFVLGGSNQRHLNVTPARDTVGPVNSVVWLTSILNPAAAGTKNKDATPRIEDAQPAFSSRLDGPALARLKDVGYVVWVDSVIDEKGQLTELVLAPEDTPVLAQTVRQILEAWRFKPARKKGKPVAAPLRFPVVFVPPGAPAPLVWERSLFYLAVLPGAGSSPSNVLTVMEAQPVSLPLAPATMISFKAIVGSDGRIASISMLNNFPPAFVEDLKSRLASWRFEPTIVDGKAVEREVDCTLRPFNRAAVTPGVVPPKPLRVLPPAYPEGLIARLEILNTENIWVGKRNGFVNSGAPSGLGSRGSTSGAHSMSGSSAPSFKSIADVPPRTILVSRELLDGSVEAKYTITDSGAVENPSVIRSSGQLFEVAAILSLVGRRYEPARNASGDPIAFSARETIFFQAPKAPIPATEYFPLPAGSGVGPSEKPPTLLKLAQPVYPSDGWTKKEDGEATAEFSVGTDGKVSKIKIVSSSHASFAESLRAALDACEFSPATRDGRPVEIILRRVENFRIPRRDPPMLKKGRTPSLVILPKKLAEGVPVYSTEELDALPVPILKPAPRYPSLIRENGGRLPRGEVMLELTIADNGTVEATRVLSATHMAFGYAAIQATTGWLFTPPRKAGIPVHTRLSVPVAFDATSAEQAQATLRPFAGHGTL